MTTGHDAALGRIADAVPGTLARLAGRVVAITVEPKGAPPALTATLDDGTGQIDAEFLGRREIPGIETGRLMVVEGRVCADGPRPRIYNPWYELAAGDE